MYVDYMEVMRKRYENLGYQAYRWFVADDIAPWTPLKKKLSQCKLGLLSTSGAYALGQIAYHYKDDSTIREIPSSTPANDLRFSHITENYLVDPRKDPNCILPTETLHKLVGKQVINSLANTVFSCMGGTYSQRRVKNEIAPEILKNFRRQDIDCALLVAM
jgi:D-proline reductase (dithiol) PrdB